MCAGAHAGRQGRPRACGAAAAGGGRESGGSGGEEPPAGARSGSTRPRGGDIQRCTSLARGDRKCSLNDGRIPNVRGVRVHVITGYNRVEGNRRASRNGLVSEISNVRAKLWWEQSTRVREGYGQELPARVLQRCLLTLFRHPLSPLRLRGQTDARGPPLPLRFATRSSLQVMEMLLDAGGAVGQSSGQDSATPLMAAAERGHVAMVRHPARALSVTQRELLASPSESS